MSNKDEVMRLEVMGLITLDGSPASLRKIAEDRDLPYSKLIKWRKELQATGENGEAALLIKADQVMVHRIAEETKADLALLGEDGVAELDGVVEGVDGLLVLNTRMQRTAIKLANRIDGLSAGVVDVRDLNSLVSSLATLQMAFFNKQTTTVNVQNNTYTSDEVSKFKSLKRD